jgi:hypothetical protein
MAAVESDLRADRQYCPRLSYDLTVKPVASEMRPYQPDRSCMSNSLRISRLHKKFLEILESLAPNANSLWIY